MAYNNGIITAPVSIYDVQRAIGVSNNDLGTLCKHANINKWAKYKPVVNTKIGVLSDDDFKNKQNIGTGLCRLYGLTVKAESGGTALALSTAYRNSDNWAYTKPYGTSDSPYRLTDFNHYCKFAEPVVKTGYKKGEVSTVNINRDPYPKFAAYFEDEDIYNVKIADFNIDPFTNNDNTYAISEGYLAVWVYNGELSDLSAWQGGAGLQAPVIAACKIKTGEGNVVEFNTSSFTFQEGNTYTLIGGIVFGENNEHVLSLPIDDENSYPARIIRIVKTWDISAELRAWSQNPYTTWHEYVEGDWTWWQETEDTVAWPTSGSSNFKLGLYIDNRNTSAFTSSSKVWIVDDSTGNVVNGQGFMYTDKACTNSTWSIDSGSNQMLYTQLTLQTLDNNVKRSYTVRLENSTTGTIIGTFTIQGSSRIG